MDTEAQEKHYVYALLREDAQTPFYIGIGTGDRWLQHEKLAHRNRSMKNNIILKQKAYGFAIPKLKLMEGITKAQAISIERDLIQLLGRAPTGILANVSAGGEGILNLTPEREAARKKAVAAAQKRPEVNAKRSATMTGRKLGPSKTRGQKRTPEQIENMKVAQRNRSAETREKIRQNLLKKWTDPAFRIRAVESAKAAWERPETREKNIEGLKKAWITKQRISRSKRHQKTLVSQP